MARISVARSLHDVGLAAWFGGTLNGAIGINGAAADVEPAQRARVANAGWARWTPVNLAAIGAHLAGAVMILNNDKNRVAAQKGVPAWSGLKIALTGGALAATAYSRVLGKKLQNAGDFPTDGGTSPSGATPPDIAKAQQQLDALQWAIPALTGALLVTSATMTEQQRPTEVLKGTALRAVDAVKHPGTLAKAGAKAGKQAVTSAI